jgi:hypothetical protein
LKTGGGGGGTKHCAISLKPAIDPNQCTPPLGRRIWSWLHTRCAVENRMPLPRVHFLAAIIVPALISLVAWIEASAAAQEFDCVLTDTAEQLGSENRTIVVVFDESAKTLRAQDGSQRYSLTNVSISTIAISGDVDSVSVGIDRSSLGIVWQQYAADKVVTEFGHCRPVEAGH